ASPGRPSTAVPCRASPAERTTAGGGAPPSGRRKPPHSCGGAGHCPSVWTICEHMFVRWSNLSIGEEERARLPGYREEAVVRHFEAPDAISTRFYEVHAKSALNRVPEASQMPFRWTINPYRGCTHACLYCLSGDTLVLMVDGTDRASQARGRDLRNGSPWHLPSPRQDSGLGPLDDGQAGLPHHARRW